MEVRISEANYEYDIHSLVKAFYPEEEVHVKEEETGENYSGFKVFYGNEKITSFIQYFVDGQEKTQIGFMMDSSDRSHAKNILKRNLYQVLSNVTGKNLTWGTLTGIRPTKIAMSMLKQGVSVEDAAVHMRKTYLTSDEKIRLCCEIAERERSILSELHGKEGFSLYVGIPFCPTTCLYCSFTSYPIAGWARRVDDYLAALEREIEFTAEVYHDRTLDTVYIGGGTPTTLSAEQLDRLIKKLKSSFNFSRGPVCEFTVEAGRPDSITEEKLRMLYKHGVSRISINPQTMNEETLKLIGRRHTISDVINAFHLARKIGFDNINMDFILGLPGEVQTAGDYSKLEHTMQEMKKLAPDSITIHSMAIKRAAGMHQWLEEHPEIKSINTPDMMEIAAKAAKEAGMLPYYLYRQKNMTGNFENTGYAKPGKFGIYNILIMEEQQSIAAVGAGTISKVVRSDRQITRCDNVKDVKIYIEKIDEIINKKRAFYDTIREEFMQ